MNFDSLKTLALNTRTAHQYEAGHSIDSGFLKSCIEISLLAPNHRLTFPWKILKVDGIKREEIAALSASMANAKGGNEDSIEKARLKVLNPSALLVFVQPLKPENTFEQKEDYATLSCSIQLLALALQSEGWHYKWSTGGLTRNERTYQALDIHPSEEEIIGFIWVGKAKSPPSLKVRPSIDKIFQEIN